MNRICYGLTFLFLISTITCLAIDNDIRKTFNNFDESSSELRIVKSPSDNLPKEFSTKSYPCPPAVNLLPCFCTHEDDDITSTLDCSLARSDEQLRNVFNGNSYFFTNLQMHYNSHLTSLLNGVFGNTMFNFVYISSVDDLEVIESDVFSQMDQTLYILEIVFCPRITSLDFDFSNHAIFTRMNVQSNQLSYLRVTSPTLSYLHAGTNKLNENNFHIDTPNMGRLTLSWNRFESVPNLEQFTKLYFIHMSGNSLSVSELAPNTFCHSDSLTTVYLNSNGYSNITKDSICVQAESTVSLEYNAITTLEEELYRTIVENVASRGFQIAGNALECGCDVAWIFKDNYKRKLALDAKCASGKYFNELDDIFYETFCLD